MTQNLSEHLSEAAAKNVNEWLTKPKYSEYKDELQGLIDEEQWEELEDSFFKVVEFGTAGRRGTTGIGSNRINRVTIGESAQALCLYAKSVDGEATSKGVVIACDTRLSSPELTQYTARVCAANGFTTYVFDSYRSTPELSFAVRHLKAAIGIVISASHNPPADNGFKAFWTDGAQLVEPHASGVLKAAEQFDEIKVIDYETAIKEELIRVLDNDVDTAYVAAVVDQAESTARDVSIVYSPLHGAGQTNTLPVLKAAGFQDISIVADQMTPDGHFPTIDGHKANPEDKIANDRAVAQMIAENADIAITNDPDADRFGVMVNHHGDVIYLSGNQSAVLAADFALKSKQAKGELKSTHYLARTIVTTDMLDALAESYGVTIYSNMLVGFKYIGELVRAKEGTDEELVVGAEESFGMIKGEYTRDKDGAVGALPLSEYAAELKREDKTLYDRLLELYVEHGVFRESLANAYFEGAKGFQKMQEVMQQLRTQPPAQVGAHKITAVLDYKSLTRTDTVTGETCPIDCLSGNVVVLEMDGDTRCRMTVRPSGTEPKIKLYGQWFSQPGKEVEATVKIVDATLSSLSNTLEGMLLD